MHKPVKNFLKVGDQNFFYVKIGEGKPVIFLPGWLSFIDKLPFGKMFPQELDSYLEKFGVHFLQLSNLYKSSFSSRPYTLDDYSDELKAAIKTFGFEKVDLIGHSAGGRFALHFAIKYPELVDKLVLMNSAGLKSPGKSSKKQARVNFFFTKLIVTAKQKELLRETFINIYHSDLTDKLSQIKNETLIVWGEKDTEMKVTKAEKFHSLIPNSRVIIYPDLGHMTIRESEVFHDILKFLNNESKSESTSVRQGI